jgi:AraC-like DNA-binding protein
MNYISVSLYEKVANHAIQEGLNPEAIPPIPPLNSQSKGPQVVPAELFFELHEIANKALPPGCAVRVGQAMKMDDYGVLGLSWKTCSRARDLFDRSVRYFMLLTNTYVFEIQDEAAVTRIFLHRDAYRRGVALSNEATFSATVTVVQLITEKELFPVEVAFQHATPTDLAVYTNRFRCPVHFGQPQNFISYRTADLNTRTAKADLSINQFLNERIEEEAKGIEVNGNKLVADIKSLIIDALPSGIPGIDQVSEHIGMSSRTLTRRLSESGFSFRELVSSTQREISLNLLQESAYSIGEIAFQTGFSEQSAFNRAFKRWTGQPPIAFRKNQS